MKSSDADPASDPAADRLPEMPQEWVRTIVSLLIFIHLFVVGLAVTTSSESGAADLPRDVKERTPLVESYLTQFWLDRGYDYYLMNDQNWDLHLEATVHMADGHTIGPLVLPENDLWPSERRQRYQQLAEYVGSAIARATAPEAREIDFERKSLLPISIGGGLLRQYPGADSVALKCIYHRGISREELNSNNPKDNDPFNPQYFTTVADLSIVLDHGVPTVFENLQPLEVSPLRRASRETTKSAAVSAGDGAAAASSGK